MNFWQKISKNILWLTIFVLPWQTRDVLVPVYYQEYFIEYASLSIYLTDLLIVILLLSWIPILITKRSFIVGPRILFCLLCLFTGWIWTSVLWVGQFDLVVSISIVAAIRFTLFLLFYLYLINNVKTIRTILWPLGWGMALQGGLALAQYFTNHSLGLRLLNESVLDPEALGVPVVIVEGVRQLRAHGTLPHANVLGGYLAIGLILISSWLYAIKRNWKHYCIWLLFIVGVLGLIVSFSRSAWLVFTLSMVVLTIWTVYVRPRKFKASILPGVIIFIAVLSMIVSQYSAIVSRFDVSQYVEQRSVNSRIEQINEFQGVYSEQPLLGVGIGQYVPYLQQINESGLGWSYRKDLSGWVYNPGHDFYEPAHNIFLLVLAELGIIGLTILILVLLTVLYLVLKVIRKRFALFALTILLALLSLASLGMVDHYLWTLQQGRLLLFLVLSLVSIVYLKSNTQKT